jgi:molybdate transport system ATP-binding protein
MIKFVGLRVTAGQFALQDISLEVPKGAYFVVMGPSGAGKTLLLETLAGLRRIQRGEIWLGDRLANDLEPQERQIALVYQEHVLFPHLSVGENIAFGLRARRLDRQSISAAVDWISGLLGIERLLPRRPGNLSGGEKQKVALARSLVVKPDVLLLDEPLSALDRSNREDVQQELKRLHGLLGTTTVHVTHDPQEALELGTRMALMESGRITRVGTPHEVLRAAPAA